MLWLYIVHDVVVIYSLRTLLQPEEVLLVSQETVQERVHHIRLRGREGGRGEGGREGGRRKTDVRAKCRPLGRRLRIFDGWVD